MDTYVDMLIKEIELYRHKLSKYMVKTIFIGGGTPSLLNNECITKIIDALKKNCNIEMNAEISIEVNPGTVNKEKLELYYDLGINRLSIGLQSCYNETLKLIGRIHSYEDYLRNVREAREVGFTNINTDLIFALPGQTVDQWIHCLSELIKLKIPHISTYSLIIEEETPFYTWVEEKKIAQQDEDTDLKMYEEGIRFLRNSGYKHYEISNFALPDYECRHNINYWLNGEYIGFGAGAHSNVNKVRYSNINDITGYMLSLKDNRLPIMEEIKTTLNDEISETMFLGLRLLEGIDISDFKRRFGKTPQDIYGDILLELKEKKLIAYDNEVIKLTESGLVLSNIVFQQLLLD